MRNAFASEITRLAGQDERVVLLMGDIGNKLFDDYRSKYPKRFFNCGVAEANMTGMAAGMAMSGLKPVTYTIAPFNTTRCLEQIRVDLCYHRQRVVVVGVGAGLSYASLGATHHSCEDISFLRSLPGMTVVCPADPVEVKLGLAAALEWDGPVYLRIGKKGEPVVHQKPPKFEIGKGIVVRDGTDACILSTGNALPLAVEAADELARRGAGTRVVSMHTVKPLDTALLEDAFGRFKVVATLEEHGLIGGLGSAVAEWMADRAPSRARLCRIGTPDEFFHEAGEQEYARERWGLAPGPIADRVAKLLA